MHVLRGMHVILYLVYVPGIKYVPKKKASGRCFFLASLLLLHVVRDNNKGFHCGVPEGEAYVNRKTNAVGGPI